MRRWGVILLVLALSAIWLGTAGAQAGPAALGEAQVYIGQGDKLWESGGRQPLTQEAVSTVYAQSPSYLVYAAASGEDRGQALYAMDLTGAHPPGPAHRPGDCRCGMEPGEWRGILRKRPGPQSAVCL